MRRPTPPRRKPEASSPAFSGGCIRSGPAHFESGARRAVLRRDGGQGATQRTLAERIAPGGPQSRRPAGVREGHLQVPRKHIERTVGDDQEERELKLGAWIGNQRSRAATLTPQRVEQLSAIGMRWA
ncbi:helicase associated domain-containing protein [Streptomyces sp. NPDC056337]|uniref:helicase associated domain-containing protein n=1 Tax=Streptomyces sp. NPDC056337 TaxID=3345787 RepID=UPI0035DB3DA6